MDRFFAPQPCQALHVHYILTDRGNYLSDLETLWTKGILSTVSPVTKACIFVALHVTEQYVARDQFLDHCQVVEILKGLEVLDNPREARQIKAKIKFIENKHPFTHEDHVSADDDQTGNDDKQEEKPRKRRKTRGIDELRRRLKELHSQSEVNHRSETCAAAHASSAVKELLESASLTGALARKVRKWAKKLPQDFLEFIVMAGSTAVWVKLADLVHFSPDDFSLKYFLSVVHGASVPEGTFVHDIRQLMEVPTAEIGEKFRKLAVKHPQVYKSFTFLRTRPRLLTNLAIAESLAHHIPLGTAIWYLEELCRASSRTVTKILTNRLEKSPNWIDEEDSKVTTSFAKLAERVMQAQRFSPDLATALMPAAAQRLGALKETVTKMPGETLTIGDASASMQTAIDSAAIFAAMVSVCWGGEVCFFSSGYIASPHPRPVTVDQVLDITHKIRANNCTAIASGLWNAYEKKTVLQRIVLVTDEEENTSCHGFMFAELLRRYMDEMNPHVELLLVGVGSGDSSFQASLRNNSIGFKRVEIDERRPDLTKFDALLRQMSLMSASEVTGTEEEASAGKEEEIGFILVDDEEMIT
eukprot:scaffold742_cov165-Amphora_coffeaeformis.AAC.26